MRQRGQGRNLAALKAELGGEARGAFQALAGLKAAKAEIVTPAAAASDQKAAPALEGQARAAINTIVVDHSS